MHHWILIQRERTGSAILIRSDVWTPSVRLSFYSFPPGRSGMGRPVRDSFENGPVQLVSVQIDFYIFSRLFKLIQITFRYVFQTKIPRDLQINF
jgi:hypothetical protein